MYQFLHDLHMYFPLRKKIYTIRINTHTVWFKYNLQYI